MPPHQRKKKTTGGKKKSRPKHDRNEKLSSCAGCSVKLGKHNNDFIYCKCTEVRFCNDACQSKHPHKDCPGPPEEKVDIFHRLGDRGDDALRIMQSRQEFQCTVLKPLNEYFRTKTKEMGNPAYFTVWEYAKLADEGEALGNQACAYMAAVKFKHRTFGRIRRGHSGRAIVNNNDAGDIPVLESQDLAFEYFEKAAKLGHGLSMQSLAECFDEGIGCRSNHRRCVNWLWRACLSHSEGAIEMIDRKAILTKDIECHMKNVDHMANRVQPGQSAELGGPNIGCLLLAFSHVIEKENYTLPPFAGTWASATVNNRPIEESMEIPRIPLIGSENIKKVMKKVHACEAQGITVTFVYGRRGTAKQATALSLSSCTSARAMGNQLFFMPPHAACNECITEEELESWRLQLLYPDDRDKVLYPQCVHHEHDRQHARLYCKECEAEAKARLEAVSRGSVVLSINEALDQRGQAAIYRNTAKGPLKMETWKNQGVGEAECVLAILVASRIPAYVAPIFIAQDPNLYWPLIAEHGCIRAALEFVAPHINWDTNLGETKDALIPDPILHGCQPRECLRKCGHGLCTNMDFYKAKKFLCSECEQRTYCSEKCQVDDWQIHKRECKQTKEDNPRVGDPKGKDENDTPSIKYSFSVKEGDDAVIHGLKAKPEYNGMIGLVGKLDGNNRFALTLRNEASKTIAIKPENLLCIGIFCRKRKKKSRVFECVHGLEACALCYCDLTTVNRLCKLKYSGNDITGSFVIDEVNETHFSSCVMEKGEDEFQMPEGLPIECYGMEGHPEHCVTLKALIEAKTPMTINAEVAKTSMITFGGAKHPHLRALTRLEKVAQML